MEETERQLIRYKNQIKWSWITHKSFLILSIHSFIYSLIYLSIIIYTNHEFFFYIVVARGCSTNGFDNSRCAEPRRISLFGQTNERFKCSCEGNFCNTASYVTATQTGLLTTVALVVVRLMWL